MRRILVSNDDGVDAPGIKALWELALEFADEVIVVAPQRCYSGMSHSITMHSPLFLESVIDEEVRPDGKKLSVWACSGSPVDCIKLALDEIIKHSLPDMILSGVNHGSNSNISVIYSGTMGAATEGAFYGIPSIGFSLCSHDYNSSLEAAIHYGRKIIERAISLPQLNPTLCWNVNVPDVAIDQIKGIKFARQTRGVWREDFLHNVDPRGRNYYWMSGGFYNGEPEAVDSDEAYLAQNYVTIVPVQMDLTNYEFLESYGSDF